MQKTLKLSLLLTLISAMTEIGWGQTFLGKDGGLEGSATIDNVNTYSVPQEGEWTKTGSTITIANETTTTRSGENALKISMTSTTMKRVYTPQFTISASTSKWYVQFFRRSASTSDTQEQCLGVIRNGIEYPTSFSYSVVLSADTWEKVTYAPISTIEATTVAGVILTKAFGTGGDVYIDDFCIYAATSVDNIAPGAPSSIVISNATQTTLDVSWNAAFGGVDDGGYLVVRYTTEPSADDDPNQNGIYAVGNTITVSNIGTVRYIGTVTSFTDSDLSPNTTYYYKVYTYDKAYNYSTEGEASDTSLPVSLTTFAAILSGNSVYFTWFTASELENQGFNLYRKLLRGEYVLLASFLDNPALAGHGSTSEKHNYQYTDNAVQPGAKYTYLLSDVNYAGLEKKHYDHEVTITIPEGIPTIAGKFKLERIYPNPFNPSFTIPITLPESQPVKIVLYDSRGRVVRTLENRTLSAGIYKLNYTIGDLSSGIYFVKIEAGTHHVMRKIVLMK